MRGKMIKNVLREFLKEMVMFIIVGCIFGSFGAVYCILPVKWQTDLLLFLVFAVSFGCSFAVVSYKRLGK